jgi:predicted metalloendopeptidase
MRQVIRKKTLKKRKFENIFRLHSQLELMTDSIRSFTERSIGEQEWMDERTKHAARVKLRQMRQTIMKNDMQFMFDTQRLRSYQVIYANNSHLKIYFNFLKLFAKIFQG